MLTFKTEAEAMANQKGLERIVPVNGVFALMTTTVYETWRNKPNPCNGCPYRTIWCHSDCKRGYMEWATVRRADRIDTWTKNAPTSKYFGRVNAEKADWRAKNNPSRFRCAGR